MNFPQANLTNVLSNNILSQVESREKERAREICLDERESEFLVRNKVSVCTLCP